ncbi:MAG: ABC transporter permease [Candidatus Heimdallarchaeota archaeon]
MVWQTVRFAFKNAFRKKLVASLSIAGIAIGIGLMVTLSSASAGFDTMLADSIADTLGDVQVTEYNKEIAISQLPTNITDIIMTIEDSAEIEAISPEIYVSGFEQFMINISIDGGGPGGSPMPFVPINARGINITNDAMFDGATTLLSNGSLYSSDYEIIVADFIASGADNGMFDIGETVDFYINFTHSIPLEVVGIFDTSDDIMAIMNPSIVMSVNTGLLVNSMYLPYEQTGYNYVKIRFDSVNLNQTREYGAQLEDLEPKMAVSITGEALESASELMENFSIIQTILTIIVIVAGGMAIFVAQLMGVSERMKEFAIMKATGWKNRTILFDIILESIIIGVIGSIVGFGLGAGLLFFAQMAASESFIVITWQIIVQTLGFGIGLGILSGLIPGIRAARVKPMEVIRGI